MNGKNSYQKIGDLYRHLSVYKKAVRFAESSIHEMLKVAPNSYLSVSFGKQSICLAHLIHQVEKLPMYFLASSETWYIHNYIEIIDCFMNHNDIDLTIVQTNRLGIDVSKPIAKLKSLHPNIKWIEKGWSDRTPSTWKKARDMGDKDLQEMCNILEWDGLFMGLVKEESKGRQITLSLQQNVHSHSNIFKYKNGKYRCCPLARWTNNDIAAYVIDNEIKLLDEYERYGLDSRTTARITKMMAEAGGMAYLKDKNITAFNQIIKNFPEVGRYV